MKKFYIFILIVLLLAKNKCSEDKKYLTLKFKTKVNENELNENNFISQTLDQNIYVDIDIGTPSQKIPMTIKTMQYPSYVVSADVNSENIKIKFNQNKSDTYQSPKKLIEYTYKYDFTKSYFSNDIFNINSKSSSYQFMLCN